MSAPVCPTQLELTHLISLMDGTNNEPHEVEDGAKILNALRYLENYLANRKGYQRKMQIKRAIITRIAHEQGWDREIDDAVKAAHSNVMEVESLDDVEDGVDDAD